MTRNLTQPKYNERIAIFDLDNTLIDSKAKLKADVFNAFRRLGVEPTEEDFKGDWFENAEKYGIAKETFDNELEKRKTWEQSLEDGEVPIFPDTKPCLEQLAENNINLGLISKSIPEYTEAKLDYFNLNDFFENIITVHPKEANKNEAAYKMMDRFNQKSNRYLTYFIGDKEEDVSVSPLVAVRFGIQSKGVYLNRQGKTLDNYLNAKDLREVSNYILENGR